MTDKLSIVTDLKKTTLYLDKIVQNFPNQDHVLKDKMLSSMYTIIEYTYIANEISNYKRVEYQKKIIAKLKMIDFYITISYKKNYIGYKKYNQICTYLINILKKVYAWIGNETIK